MQLVFGPEAFERRDGSLHRAYRCAAGADCGAVHDHRAGSALREPAAELGAIELEIVPENVEERRVGLDRHLAHVSVDGEAKRLRHEHPSRRDVRRRPGFCPQLPVWQAQTELCTSALRGRAPPPQSPLSGEENDALSSVVHRREFLHAFSGVDLASIEIPFGIHGRDMDEVELTAGMTVMAGYSANATAICVRS